MEHTLQASASQGSPVAEERWAHNKCVCGFSCRAEGDHAFENADALFQTHLKEHNANNS